MRLEKLTYLLFIISNFLMIVNPGDFWDDWAYVSQVPERIIFQFKSSGIAVFGYLFVYIQKFFYPTFLHRSLTILLQLSQLFLLFRILDHYPVQKKNLTYLSFSILIFAVFPHYDAKITMVVFPYTLCLTFFILASFLLIKYYYSNRNWVFRILSMIFFFLSFFTNSLLFFYLFPIFFVLVFENWQQWKITSFKNFKLHAGKVVKKVLKYFDFFILPFLFWTIKAIYFKPSAQYKEIGYNSLSVESLLDIPSRIIKFIYVTLSTLAPLILDAIKYPELWILLIILFLFLFRIIRKWDFNFKISVKHLIWGVLVFFAGAFPYLMVNKYPSYIHYMSRHQLLIGFGTSFLISVIVFSINSILFKRIFISVILSVFVCFNIFIQFSFFKGFVKQEVIQEFFVNTGDLHRTSPRTIVLDDKTEDFTQKGNPTKFYAFAGMLKRSYKNENILIVRDEDLKGYKKTKLFTIIGPYFANYNLSNYQFTEPDYELEINYSEKKLPKFLMIKFYGDFLRGDTNDWDQYFDFDLHPI